MSIIYPMQRLGSFGLGLGFCYSFLHEKFGVDLGERYHKDIEYRIRTTMEIDRAVYDAYGEIGLGFKDPFPRCTIEPFGHRFMPAMYGCECVYNAGSEPWGKAASLTPDKIEGLMPWTRERFENSVPVQEVLSQARWFREHYKPAPSEYCPHYRTLSSLQNLGSVLNTGFCIMGQDIYIDYLNTPDLVRKLYGNITELMLLCLEYFPEFDKEPLTDVFVGDCEVAMLSPAQYMNCNYDFDMELVKYARKIGASFLVHQDSDVTPHLKNYTKLEYVQGLDFGQDTDWEKAVGLFPDCDASCILFPSWVNAHSEEELHSELSRLMGIGRRFKSFSFTLYEIDSFLGNKKIFDFYEIFKACAGKEKK